MDVAASVQAVTEEFVLRLARNIRSEFVIPNLCLAGGVALNCVANGRMLREGLKGLLVGRRFTINTSRSAISLVEIIMLIKKIFLVESKIK